MQGLKDEGFRILLGLRAKGYRADHASVQGAKDPGLPGFLQPHRRCFNEPEKANGGQKHVDTQHAENHPFGLDVEPSLDL